MHGWTVRARDLGRTSVEHTALRVALEVYDGGGVVCPHGIWRIAGRIARIDVAARC